MKYAVRSGDGYFVKFIFGNTPYMTTDLTEAYIFTFYARAKYVKDEMNKVGYVADIIPVDPEIRKIGV